MSFTWSPKCPRIFCRLDYWLISNNLNDLVRSTDIIPAIRTDHDAIFLEIGKLQDEIKGPGHWKMICSLLADEEYIDSINEMIPIWTAEGRKDLSDDRSVWEWIKFNIRAHAICHSKRKAKQRNERESYLEKELNEAKLAFERNPDDVNATRYYETRERLESFYYHKTKGIIIRARARFLNLEKRNHVKKHIRKLNINGKIETDPMCILKEQEGFYRELYKSSHREQNVAQNISSFLSELNIPKLSEKQKRSISSEECFRLLDSFHNNKTPGNDGIPIEFYKEFWHLISA